MRNQNVPPVYEQVAYDIASKIAAGELKESQRFSGRSLMGSQYGVSSETIRRALRILADAGIAAVQQNVGAVVQSRSRAVEYVKQYQADKDRRALKARLQELIAKRNRINGEIDELFGRIMDLEERFHRSDQLRTYEFRLEKGSGAAGRSIGELEFRQNTGATVIAVRRGIELTLSPGPELTLQEGDALVVACNVTDISRVSKLIE